MANRIFASGLVALAALGLWAVVILSSVEWPLNPYRHENAVFRLGPVSADVQAGQTFASAEPFNGIAVPVKVGGPVDKVAWLHARVYIRGPSGMPTAESAPALAVSTPRPFEMVRFWFPTSLPAGDLYYVEIDVPRQTPWPIFLAATSDDEELDGQLFMRGAPTFAGQDLAYQLLRSQSILGRLPIWWATNQAAVIVGAALVALVHFVSFAAVGALPRRARPSLWHWTALALAPPALLTVAYFALLFFVL